MQILSLIHLVQYLKKVFLLYRVSNFALRAAEWILSAQVEPEFIQSISIDQLNKATSTFLPIKVRSIVKLAQLRQIL